MGHYGTAETRSIITLRILQWLPISLGIKTQYPFKTHESAPMPSMPFSPIQTAPATGLNLPQISSHRISVCLTPSFPSLLKSHLASGEDHFATPLPLCPRTPNPLPSGAFLP